MSETQARQGSSGRVRSALRRVVRVVFYVIACFVLLSVFLVLLYREVPPPATPLMLLRYAAGHGIDKSWRSIDEISPFLIRAVVAAEDSKFCHHNGFDWGAKIGRAHV